MLRNIHSGIKRFFMVAVLLVALFVPQIVLCQDDGIEIVDDLMITQDIKLQPGVYILKDINGDGIIRIEGENITLDGKGLFIVGESRDKAGQYLGYGIKVVNSHGITLKNFDVSGFEYGIWVENSADILIENSNISGNEKDIQTSFLSDLLKPYGGGIMFQNVHSSTVRNNILTNQSTGIDLFYGHNNSILDNTTSTGPEGNESDHE